MGGRRWAGLDPAAQAHGRIYRDLVGPVTKWHFHLISRVIVDYYDARIPAG
jgi:hypothetical protein